MMRQERIRLDWTQEYVGTRTGVTPEAIQMVEPGQRKPSFDVLVKLEDLSGMEYRDLFNIPKRQLREQKGATDGNQALDE